MADTTEICGDDSWLIILGQECSILVKCRCTAWSS